MLLQLQNPVKILLMREGNVAVPRREARAAVQAFLPVRLLRDPLIHLIAPCLHHRRGRRLIHRGLCHIGDLRAADQPVRPDADRRSHQRRPGAAL